MAEPTSKPRASRPHAPGYGIKPAEEGSGLLPWDWAEERLNTTRNFFISTAGPNGAPHLMVIWGLWLDGKFFFSSGRNSRKAKNLAGNSRCTIATGNADETVVLEGTVSLLSDRELRRRYIQAVTEKYDFDMGPYAEEPVYILQPRRAFGLIEKNFLSSATRWTWD